MNPDAIDRTGTHLVAFGAVFSPLWIHTLSDAATTFLPIMGVLWLIIQSIGYIYTTFWKKTDQHDSKN